MATPNGDEETKVVAGLYDALESKYDVDGMYELMTQHRDTDDPDLVWRLAQALLEKGRNLGGDAKKRHIYEAFEHIKRTVDSNEDNHKVLMWFCILLSQVSEYEGIKTKIDNSHKCKDYLQRGLKLAPTSPQLMHCMGVWCFEVSNLSFLERKAASLLFGEPPKSTYQEALQYFEDAEKAQPGFYISNNLMLAKTLLKMKKDKDRARELLQQTVGFDSVTMDDEEANNEAVKILWKEFSLKV